MARKEFMEHLEKLLWDISESERTEALQYYENYFDDAGEENEAQVLKDLGSPVQVARKIKAGFNEQTAEYSEQGYEDTRFRDAMEMLVEEEKKSWKKNDADPTGVPRGEKQSNGGNTWKIVAIALVCIIGIPIVLPIAVGILGTVWGILIAAAAILFSLILVGAAILICGMIYIGIGIINLFAAPAVGMAMTGSGCLLFSLGLLISWLMLKGTLTIIPWLIRTVVELAQYPFRKAGVIR